MRRTLLRSSSRGRPPTFTFTVEQPRASSSAESRSVTKYFNVLITFGRYSDDDSRYPWIRGILESDQPERVRVALLYEAALENESSGRGYFARPQELF